MDSQFDIEDHGLAVGPEDGCSRKKSNLYMVKGLAAMNLQKKSNDPRRMLRWGDKSVIMCSRVELIDCILHLSQQLSTAGAQNQAMLQVLTQAGMIKETPIGEYAPPLGSKMDGESNAKETSNPKEKSKQHPRGHAHRKPPPITVTTDPAQVIKG